ncbi:MAG: 4Fe-4S dicluster domain-containing protein [Chlamydiia bacterium]|nr:4Fe-4S dicluster domain-containing protein [Chlamydiia bacterium]
MDRGEFFSKAFTLLVGKGAALVEDTGIVSVLEDLTTPKPSAHRPPGASSKTAFTAACTGCDACMIACPHNVVMVEDMEQRHPLIYPDTAPCLRCDSYPCIAACPTAALAFDHASSECVWVRS